MGNAKGDALGYVRLAGIINLVSNSEKGNFQILPVQI